MSWMKRVIRKAQEDTPDGFLAFYTLIHGIAPPKHAMGWIRELYNVPADKVGTVIEAFRGSTKTTTANTYVAHQIGLYPHRSNLVVTGGEDKATDSGQAISDIIENNPKWEWIFPHVVPDKSRGWSANGYEVMRTDISYGEWRRKNANRRDPTLLALSYNARGILGSHPDGVLLVDDMNNEQNTASRKELYNCNKILTDTMFPMMRQTTHILIIGTPWVENDVIWYVKDTDHFVHIFTPAEDEKGELVWPEEFSREVLDAQKDLAGTIGYARMYLLSLEAMKGHTLKRHWLGEYPAQSIDSNWPVFVGVDYASTEDTFVTKDRKRKKDPDYFAMAWGRITPDGKLVVVDGKRLHISQAEAEKLMVAYAANTPTLQQMGVEAIGEGRGFYNTLFNNQQYMPLLPVTHKKKSKGHRFQEVMAPFFELGVVKLSDATTEFLMQFIDEWVSFPYGRYDDCLDAVYCLIFAAQAYIKMPSLQKFPPNPLWKDDTKKSNPYKGLVRA